MVTEAALVFLTWAVSCWTSWIIGFHQGMKEGADGD